MPAFDVDRFRNEIETHVSEKHGIAIRVEKQPTIDTLQDPIDDFAPHVVHFVGYGRYSREGVAEIALVGDDGSAFPVGDVQFAGALKMAQREKLPKVFVLHLSEAGSDAEWSELSFERLAPALVREGIPSVIAMRSPVHFDTASRFSRWFYRELAGGGSVDAAVFQGRRMVWLKNDRPGVFGTPVLYMHSEGALIDSASTPVAADTPRGARLSPVNNGGTREESPSIGPDNLQERSDEILSKQEGPTTVVPRIQRIAKEMIDVGRRQLAQADLSEADTQRIRAMLRRMNDRLQTASSPRQIYDHLCSIDATGDGDLSAVIDAMDGYISQHLDYA